MKDLLGICFACLSIDRKLFKLYEVQREFPCPISIDFIIKCWMNSDSCIQKFKRLRQQFHTAMLNLNQPTQICWECKAMLMKISHFTARATAAREALRLFAKDNLISITDYKSYPLSKLGIKKLPTVQTDIPNPTVQHTNTILPDNQVNSTQNSESSELILLPQIKTECTENEIKIESDNENETTDCIKCTENEIKIESDNENETTVCIMERDPIGYDQDEMNMTDELDREPNITEKTVEDDIPVHAIFPMRLDTLLKAPTDTSKNKNKSTHYVLGESNDARQSNLNDIDMTRRAIIPVKIGPLLRNPDIKGKETATSTNPMLVKMLNSNVNKLLNNTTNIKSTGLQQVPRGSQQVLRVTSGHSSGFNSRLLVKPKFRVLNLKSVDSSGLLKKYGLGKFNQNNVGESNEELATVEGTAGKDESNKDGRCSSDETDSAEEVDVSKNNTVSKAIFVSEKPKEVMLKMGQTYKMYPEKDAKDSFSVTRISEKKMMDIRETRKSHKSFMNAKFKCVNCVLTFASEEIFANHQVLHKAKHKYKCDICEITFLKQDDLDYHRDHHTWYYKCCSCDFGSLWLKYITNHVTEHHEKYETTCYKCNENFETLNERKKHYRVKHRKPRTCEQCGKIFYNNSNLHWHIRRIHSQEKDNVKPQIPCPQCDKKFISKGALNYHVKWKHENSEEPYCVQCDKKFSSHCAFNSHMKYSQAHNSKESFQHVCKFCGARFAARASLNSHETHIHSDRKDFKCDCCNMQYKTKMRLRMHKATKHEGYVKPKNKICDYCGKAFNGKATLQQHIHTHTGERPYVCEYCGADFAFSGARYTHIKLKHKKKKILNKESCQPNTKVHKS